LTAGSSTSVERTAGVSPLRLDGAPLRSHGAPDPGERRDAAVHKAIIIHMPGAQACAQVAGCPHVLDGAPVCK